MRRFVPPQPPKTKAKTYAAPRRGWIKNENLAISKPEGASVLTNWFPTATGCRVRKGTDQYATIGSAAVTALMVYTVGASDKFFAADASNIYDITTIADADTAPTATVTGLAGGGWQYAQFATDGGTFLVAVNAADDYYVYDGTDWTNDTYAITGVDSSTLNYVWGYQKRLFFTKKDSLDAYYLPVNQIAGKASVIPLGGVFRLGGSLLFGATWSVDSGSGLQESCVFVTTEGEIAIYVGSNPTSADSWQLKGVYQCGKPLGARAWMRAGGDLLIATDIGLVPLSQAVAKDKAALAMGSVSFPIEDAWVEAAQLRQSLPWSVEVWPTRQLAMIGTPTTTGQNTEVFVVNVRTGAWAPWDGDDVRCLALFKDRFFYGTSDGSIVEIEVGGSMLGEPYTATCAMLFDDIGSGISYKNAVMVKPTILAPNDPEAQVFAMADYIIDVPSIPSAGPSPEDVSVWGTAKWGSSKWGQKRAQQRFGDWAGVTAHGQALAPGVQITIGGTVEPDIDLVSLTLLYETGAAVV